MAQKVQTALSCRLDITRSLPADFVGSRISDLPNCTYKFPFGYLTIQEVTSGESTLNYQVLQATQRFPYTISLDPEKLHVLFLLYGKIIVESDPPDAGALSVAQWKLFNRSKSISIENEENGTTELILISFGEKLLSETSALFPSLPAQLSDLTVNSAKTSFIPLEICEYITSILQCRYEDVWRNHFIEHRIGDILFSLLVYLIGENPFHEIGPDDLASIQEAERIIRRDITKHWTLQKLADEVGMSLTKFKELFKRVYHLTPPEYHRKLQLEQSVMYLKAGCSVKESAYKSGWRPAVFIEVFRKKYLTTPGNYQRSNKSDK